MVNTHLQQSTQCPDWLSEGRLTDECCLECECRGEYHWNISSAPCCSVSEALCCPHHDWRGQSCTTLLPGAQTPDPDNTTNWIKCIFFFSIISPEDLTSKDPHFLYCCLQLHLLSLHSCLQQSQAAPCCCSCCLAWTSSSPEEFVTTKAPDSDDKLWNIFWTTQPWERDQ